MAADELVRALARIERWLEADETHIISCYCNDVSGLHEVRARLWVFGEKYEQVAGGAGVSLSLALIHLAEQLSEA